MPRIHFLAMLVAATASGAQIPGKDVEARFLALEEALSAVLVERDYLLLRVASLEATVDALVREGPSESRRGDVLSRGDVQIRRSLTGRSASADLTRIEATGMSTPFLNVTHVLLVNGTDILEAILARQTPSSAPTMTPTPFCPDGSDALHAGASCDAIAKHPCVSYGALIDGPRWLSSDGFTAQAHCCFTAGDGWTLVLKVAPGNADFYYGSALWTSTATTGEANVLTMTAGESGKSVFYSHLAAASFRLCKLADAGASFVQWSYSGTARALLAAGSGTYAATAGAWDSFDISQTSFQSDLNQADFPSGPVYVLSTGTYMSGYSCCGVYGAATIGVVVGGGNPNTNGHSGTGFKGVGGVTQYVDAHASSCCPYTKSALLSVSSSEAAGIALLVK